MNQVCIELFAGLHGWGEGFAAEGFVCIGFDIEDMGKLLGIPRPPNCHLVLQDVRTLHGSQFKNAACIAASPPCQGYSYRAMPWSRAKALPPPSNELFDACFRIQREACEAAGRHIPLVVENVRGAQKWVGRAKWHFGSYYLWGDLPALMPIAMMRKTPVGSWDTTRKNYNPDHSWKTPGFRFDGSGKSFQSEAVKVSGLNFSDYGKPGYKARAFNDTAVRQIAERKSEDGGSWFGDYQAQKAEHIKQHGSGREWFAGDGKISRLTSSKSPARKAASALIAKIPFALANHIAKSYALEAIAVS